MYMITPGRGDAEWLLGDGVISQRCQAYGGKVTIYDPLGLYAAVGELDKIPIPG
jgi:hypothetical protein